jgi:8-oxo-dGTP pyrophosphatase MutT (NUDIX family)
MIFNIEEKYMAPRDEIKQAVCVMIKVDQGYLSVTRRDSDQWGLVGGKVDPGETSLQAAVREAHEEVGLVLDPSLLRKVFAQMCPGQVDYLTTTFIYPDLDPAVVSQLTPESGLTIGVISQEMLCNVAHSPFAGYNQDLFQWLAHEQH